jgi:hypothetical protein
LVYSMALPRRIKLERMPLHDTPNWMNAGYRPTIAEDPTILGLGDLVLKDKEPSRPRADQLNPSPGRVEEVRKAWPI